MEWKGLNKSVNAERSKGYHVASVKMMTNVYGRCFRCMGRGRNPVGLRPAKASLVCRSV